jgi:hypothetical protein
MGAFDRFNVPEGNSAGTMVVDNLETYSGDIYDIKILFDYLNSIKDTLPSLDEMSTLAKIEDSVIKDMDGIEYLNIPNIASDTQEIINLFQDGKTITYKDSDGNSQEIVINNMSYIGVEDEHIVIKNDNNEIVFDINSSLERIVSLEDQVSNLASGSESTIFYEEETDESGNIVGYTFKDIDSEVLFSTSEINGAISDNDSSISDNKSSITNLSSVVSDNYSTLDSKIDSSISDEVSRVDSLLDEKLEVNSDDGIFKGDTVILSIPDLNDSLDSKLETDSDSKKILIGDTEILDTDNLVVGTADTFLLKLSNNGNEFTANGTTDLQVIYDSSSDDYSYEINFGEDFIDSVSKNSDGEIQININSDYTFSEMVPMLSVITDSLFGTVSISKDSGGIVVSILVKLKDTDGTSTNGDFYISLRIA